MNILTMQGKSGNAISARVAGSGPVLILLHGFPLDHRLWADQLANLSQSLQVIAIELRGFGQSTMGESSYSIADLADDVEVVRSQLAADKRIILCGLSMGGYVAFEYWRRHTNHLAALILANTKPEADTTAAKSARLHMASSAMQRGAWQAVSGMLHNLLTKNHIANRTSVCQVVERMMRDCSAEAICAAQHAMAERADFVASLPRIQLPTLVVTGQFDSIAPPASTRKWAAVLPEAQCIVSSDAAHLTPLESPQEFNASVLKFIQGL